MGSRSRTSKVWGGEIDEPGYGVSVIGPHHSRHVLWGRICAWSRGGEVSFPAHGTRRDRVSLYEEELDCCYCGSSYHYSEDCSKLISNHSQVRELRARLREKDAELAESKQYLDAVARAVCQKPDGHHGWTYVPSTLPDEIRRLHAEIERLRLLCAGLRDVIDGKTKSIEQIRAARSTPAEERE
jgi:hypothetical protein